MQPIKIAFAVALFLLQKTVGFAQSHPQVYFIAVDHWGSVDGRITSRILINSEKRFNCPNEIEIYTDSIASTFGFIAIERLDSVRKVFEKFEPRIQVCRVFEKVTQPLRSVSELNLALPLAPKESFGPGLYRARVKVLIGTYNRGMKNVISNWSYFFIGNNEAYAREAY